MSVAIKMAYSYFAAFVGTWAIVLMAFTAGAQNLYVGLYGSGVIDVVTPSGALQTNFITGLSEPDALAFNGAGNLFVANTLNGTIYEFTNYNGTLTTNINVFATGLSLPFGLAFDRTGDLFESDIGSGKVYEFTNRSGTLNPTAGVFATNLDPVGLAFDRKGNLFEADYNTSKINEFTNQNGTLDSTAGVFVSGLAFDGPGGLAFDGTSNLYVSIDNRAGEIIKITPDGTQSTFASYLTTIGLDNPLGVAFNNAGNLFVANQEADQSSGGTVIEYFQDGSTNFFATGLTQPTCVAFAPTVGLQVSGTNQPTHLSISTPSPYYTIWPTIVQASTNLVQWTNVYTNMPPYNYIDPASSQYRYRFYRAELVP